MRERQERSVGMGNRWGVLFSQVSWGVTFPFNWNLWRLSEILMEKKVNRRTDWYTPWKRVAQTDIRRDIEVRLRDLQRDIYRTPTSSFRARHVTLRSPTARNKSMLISFVVNTSWATEKNETYNFFIGQDYETKSTGKKYCHCFLHDISLYLTKQKVKNVIIKRSVHHKQEFEVNIKEKVTFKTIRGKERK